jgi:hypothetical protein
MHHQQGMRRMAAMGNKRRDLLKTAGLGGTAAAAPVLKFTFA